MEPIDPNAAATSADDRSRAHSDDRKPLPHAERGADAGQPAWHPSAFEASIEGENYFRMLGSMVPGIDGIRVQVRQVDAEAALEILNQGPEQTTIEE